MIDPNNDTTTTLASDTQKVNLSDEQKETLLYQAVLHMRKHPETLNTMLNKPLLNMEEGLMVHLALGLGIINNITPVDPVKTHCDQDNNKTLVYVASPDASVTDDLVGLAALEFLSENVG